MKLSPGNSKRQDVSEREKFVNKMKKLGFTLAEVLIVVAIIGVISMILIRVWHGSIDGQEFDTGVQKMISRLSQALRMNRVTHDFENWDDIFGANGGDNIQRDLLSRNLKVVKIDDGNKIAEKYPDGKFFNYSDGENKIYTLKDGIQYSLFQNEDETIMIENEPVKVIMVIDVNGTHKGPNTPGKDVRMLALTINRADEFKGGEPWCGDECVNTSMGALSVSSLTQGKERYNAYKECTANGSVLASSNEMMAILESPSARAKAGVSSDEVSCYNLRDNGDGTGDYETRRYACYNPFTDEAKVFYNHYANSFYQSTYFNSSEGAMYTLDSGNNRVYDFADFAETNGTFSWRGFQSLCVKDEATAKAQKKYPGAELVVNGKAYRAGYGCFGNSASSNGVENCGDSDWGSQHPYFDKAVAYCEHYGMRLPTYDELTTILSNNPSANPNQIGTLIADRYADVFYSGDTYTQWNSYHGFTSTNVKRYRLSGYSADNWIYNKNGEPYTDGAFFCLGDL